MRPQVDQRTIAIIGAGVIGCAAAWALAREGQSVLLIDRREPGRAGASFGNVGHVAAELVEPLPSPQLLFGFWRLLFALGGPLHVPLRHLPQFLPWAREFAAASFKQAENTLHLAPLVKPAATAFERVCSEIGRRDLLRRNGHYQFWFGAKSASRALDEARHMEKLSIQTAPVPQDALAGVAAAAKAKAAAGLWFPETAHIVDPFLFCSSLAQAAAARGTQFWRADVQAMQPSADGIELFTSGGSFTVSSAIVCAGAESAQLLTPFGLRAPLEAARGYHVELPSHPAHVDGPIVYMDRKILVTPMAGRLRASGFMEFTGQHAPPDPRKPARLRRIVQELGYRCEDDGPSWLGSRPILPDYLPGIGRAPGPHRLFYAIGHQHIGLTLAPITGDLLADLVAERTPRHDVTGFDLRRFSGGKAYRAQRTLP